MISVSRSGRPGAAIFVNLSGPGVILNADPDVPVVGVTRSECTEFCRWLTERERDNPNPDLNRITKDFRYRLPTDREWSRMMGLIEVGETPAEREQENAGQFPWGQSFPPPAGAGNYADASAIQIIENSRIIDGYEDGFPRLARVGSFSQNIIGIFDLGGNAHEWVSDSYDDMDRGILRGGGWDSFTRSHLESHSRYVVSDVEKRGESFGFRVVLARDAEEPPEETSEEEDDG